MKTIVSLKKLGVHLFPLFLLSCASGGVWVKPISPTQGSYTPRCLLIPPFENLSLTSRAGMILGELIALEVETRTGADVLSPLEYLSLVSLVKPPSQDPLAPENLLFFRERLGIEAILGGTITEYWYTDDPEVYRDKQPSIGIFVRLIRTDTNVELFHAVVTRTYTSLLGDTLPLTALAQKVAEEVAQVLTQQLLRPQGTYSINKEAQAPCRFLTLIAPPTVTALREGEKPTEPSPAPTTEPPPTSPPPREAPSTSTPKDSLVLLEELAQGKTVILKGVKFKKKSTELLPGSEQGMIQVAQILKEDPQLRVRILVHTDSEGDAEELKRLTTEQALALKKILTNDYGVPPQQLEVEGRGGVENIVPNTNEFLREVNRRVEVVLISPGSQGDGKAEGPPR